MYTKNKIIFGVSVFLFVVGVAWLQMPWKVVLVDSETGLPVKNQEVEVEYRPICVESPCVTRILFSGNTGEDGVVRLSLPHALFVNRKVMALESLYEYHIHSQDYTRDIGKQPSEEGENIIYVMRKK